MWAALAKAQQASDLSPDPFHTGCSAHCFHPRCQQRVSGSPGTCPVCRRLAGSEREHRHLSTTWRRHAERARGVSVLLCPGDYDLKTGSDPVSFTVCCPLFDHVPSHICSSDSTSQSTQRTLTAGCPRGSDLQVTPSDVSAGSTGGLSGPRADQCPQPAGQRIAVLHGLFLPQGLCGGRRDCFS